MLNRVGVVGNAAHDIARFVLAVVAQRQSLDMAEDLDPQRTQHMLAGVRHQIELQAGQQRADEEHGGD